MQYSSGIFKCNYSTTDSDLNHAILIIGYDSSGNYLIKNSWGTSWGTAGFGWVSGNTSQNCGLNLYAYQMSSKTFVNSNSATTTPSENTQNQTTLTTTNSTTDTTTTTKSLSHLQLPFVLTFGIILFS